jgi:hypothetical protein
VRDYTARLPLYREERDQLERKFIAAWEEIRGASIQERADFTARSFAEAGQATKLWTERVSRSPVQNRSEVLYALAWRNINKQAKLPTMG